MTVSTSRVVTGVGDSSTDRDCFCVFVMIPKNIYSSKIDQNSLFFFLDTLYYLH